ncbi:MAG TPA: DinB family protein [Longimicrobiales bacterium]|nr:DinB family protein [Longimicrobiales bacterium]
MIQRTAASLLLVPLLAFVSACRESSADGAAATAEGAGAASAETAATDAQDMVDHLLEQARTAREKLEGLAEAIPEEAYDWRPGEGVRSVGEVFIHVAADNYLLPAILGVEAPAETGITADYATVQAYEARELSKAEIVAGLRASFDHLEAAVASTRTDLDRTATAFGTEFTTGGLWTMAVTHLHEHLGQGIAYARSNGVVPPWSR